MDSSGRSPSPSPTQKKHSGELNWLLPLYIVVATTGMLVDIILIFNIISVFRTFRR